MSSSRCTSCNKFVSRELQEPEVQSIEIEGEGLDRVVNVTVRLVRACIECGDEMTEQVCEESHCADYEALNGHTGEGHDLEIEEGLVSQTEVPAQKASPMVKAIKASFGATVNYTIKCECQKEDADPLVDEEIDLVADPSAWEDLQ